MKPKKINLLVYSLVLTSFTSFPVFAHDHGKNQQISDGTHNKHTHSVSTPASLSDAWAVVQNSVEAIQKSLKNKDLKAIHESEEKLSVGLKAMQELSTNIEPEKKKRLDSALKQALTTANNVHVASDAGDQIKTEAEFKKLQGALKLVEAQLPTDVIKMSNIFICPMNCVAETDKAGKCSVCGMDLVRKTKARSEAHSDHDPKRGGVLMMSGDYHLEGVVVGQEFRVFFYDEYTKPIPIGNISGQLVLPPPQGTSEDSPEKTLPLKMSSSGAYLFLPLPSDYPKDLITVNLFINGRNQPFSFPAFSAKEVLCKKCNTSTSVGKQSAACWNCKGTLNDQDQCSKCAKS
jgi:hypothetical protein